MNKRNLKTLAAVLAGLVLVLVVLQTGQDDATTGNGLLLPELKSRINDIRSVTITRAGEPEPTVISKEADRWIVASRDGYPADIGKLRELLLTLADARAVEKKTANPDLHERLGLRDPGVEGSKGILLELHGGESAYRLIIGNTAQGGYRYVRIADDPQSWLIDKNPGIPDAPGGWLERNIVDIKAADVRSVTIRHPDGEEIRIEKAASDATDFDVLNIPDGRELSYATVANSIAGALTALTLDEVRRAEAGTADAITATFETYDGARIVVEASTTEDESWIALRAESIEREAAEAEAADEEAGDADEVSEPVADAETETRESVESINARVAGWQYRIPEYKANQLTRRWDDILKAEAEEN